MCKQFPANQGKRRRFHHWSGEFNINFIFLTNRKTQVIEGYVYNFACFFVNRFIQKLYNYWITFGEDLKKGEFLNSVKVYWQSKLHGCNVVI